ncbi:MAG: Tir chaperone protein (CesT) family [Solimicrobium sp.]|jgi:hypothetical protein|nr:Tir chaperone protein (CesT) family [Solimicrobium sp.]
MSIDFRNEWLSQLGTKLGIPELVFDHAGICQMNIDPGMTVTIHKPPEEESLVLLGQLPVSNLSTALMQKMLVENRSYDPHPTPILSLSENLDTVEVHFRLTPLELKTADDALEKLIGNLEYWRSHLM